LTEACACEKDMKEKWLGRYEVERESNAKLNDELIVLKN